MAVIRINEIIDRLQDYHPQADVGLVQKAYVWSAKLHAGSLRKSGLPYLSHPLEVAEIMTQLKLHESSVAAGLLHDVLEDSSITYEELEDEFGKEIAKLVDGVTKIGRITASDSRVVVQTENYRKMILAMARDVRVILIKLADRLHNMRTLEYLDEERQIRIAQETLDIYAPIAGRLGIHWIKGQLEDLSFKFLKPEIYERISTGVEKIIEARREHVDRIKSILEKHLTDAGFEASVSGRFKHLWSIYQKMERQKLLLEEVHDLVAFRILVDNIPQCYDALRVIHSIWTPVPGRIKDYIALPKANMYRSLHTTVIGPEGERVEIQIRTHEMHALAEYGIAAHWRYKEDGAPKPKGGGEDEEKTLQFLHHLVEFHEELKDPYQFLESIKTEVIPDMIVVFTPSGDLVELPTDSTPIDFAYQIHSDIGDRAAGAKVNGRIVPLSQQLNSGDTVEILTSKSVEPSKAWLELVKSPKARARIAHFISSRESERVRELGRQMLEAELLKHGKALGKLIEDGTMDQVVKRYSFASINRMLEAVGFGKFPVRKVLTQILPPEDLRPKAGKGKKKTTKKKTAKKKTKAAARKKTGTPRKKKGESKDESGYPVVEIANYHDPFLSMAECCRPLAGDDVTGIRRDDQVVEIHRSSCPRALEAHPERLVSGKWKKDVEGEAQTIIEVISEDRKGLLATLSSEISSANLNINRALVHTTEDKRAIHTFRIGLKNLAQLNGVIKKIEKIDGVISVTRKTGGVEDIPKTFSG